jgi:hypothetical protein
MQVVYPVLCDEGLDTPLCQNRKDSLEVILSVRGHNFDRASESPDRILSTVYQDFGIIVWIDQNSEPRRVGDEVVQRFQALCNNIAVEHRLPGDIPAQPIGARQWLQKGDKVHRP